MFLNQNYPNPFNPSTTIRYVIKGPGRVTLNIYGVDGTLVRTLVDENQVPKNDGYVVRWNGRDNLGRPVSSGVYFCVLRMNGVAKTRKMVLSK